MIEIDNLYFKSKYRGSILTDSIWNNIIQNNVIYYSGFMENFCLFFDLDDVYYTLDILDSKNQNIINQKSGIISSNNLNFICSFMSLNIDLTLNKKDNFKKICNSTRFYYSKDDKDLGIVDCVSEYDFDISHIYELQSEILPKISREIQYSVLKNIMYIDIESDSKLTYLADFEYYIHKSKILKQDFMKVLEEEVNNKKDKELIINIYNQFKEKNEL